MAKIYIPQSYIDDGLIRVQTHPSFPLRIFNYTEKTAFDRLWDNITLQCRGLILDNEDNMVARPFSKFFNLDEPKPYDVPFHEPFEVTEKMDGSLGISYFVNDMPYIATRGSFASDQAIKATEILNEKYSHIKLNPEFTYIWEIIFPKNRIVVNYGEKEDLILLGVIVTDTGLELPLNMFRNLGFPLVERHDITDLSLLNKQDSTNREGFVIRFLNSNIRVKVKFDEYVRLHRIVSMLNEKTVWEALSTGTLIDLEGIPDEIFNEVKALEKLVQDKFDAIDDSAYKAYNNILTILPVDASRKEFAHEAQKYGKIASVLFAMLDSKNTNQIIWKMIKPKSEDK